MTYLKSIFKIFIEYIAKNYVLVFDLVKNFSIKKLSKFIMDFLEKEAIKKALIKFLGSATTGGLRAYLITWFIKNILFDKALEPMMVRISIQIGYKFNQIEGHFKFEKLKKAEQSGDQDAYDEAIDDIIG